MRNAALLGLMQPNLETVDIHSSFSLVAILGRSVALFGIYWPSSGEGQLEGLQPSLLL